MSEQIRLFQQKNNLDDDGIIGRNTLSKMKSIFQINSNEHMGHWIGQMTHETNDFSRGTESLNYSVESLIRNFGRHRISEADCKRYGRSKTQPAHQVSIGNTLYGGQWGKKNLGNTQPGDGFLFRGRGGGQTTGRYNYQLLSNYLNDPEIMCNPDLVNEKYYFQSALFFFTHNKIWKYCDNVNDTSILTVSRALNLGNPFHRGIPNHLQDRKDKTYFYYKKMTT